MPLIDQFLVSRKGVTRHFMFSAVHVLPNDNRDGHKVLPNDNCDGHKVHNHGKPRTKNLVLISRKLSSRYLTAYGRISEDHLSRGKKPLWVVSPHIPTTKSQSTVGCMQTSIFYARTFKHGYTQTTYVYTWVETRFSFRKQL